MRFLIVEDSRTAQNLIKNYVSEIDIGCEASFIEVKTGEAALEAIEANHVDFVLLDWNLSSKMTGLDILKTIRGQDRFRKLPIIMVTSEGEKPKVIEALKCGASDYTVKPIDKKVFSEKVLKLAMGIIYKPRHGEIAV
ncbi:MAG: response regulator [Treponema sp.]|nr:response regulator [Treponema sp.]